MTTTTVSANGKARKSLAEQIDRLDQILDGLADGLNGAVADALRESVGQAVQQALRGVLIEALTNPQMLAGLRGLLAASEQPVTKVDEAPVAAPAVSHVSVRACLARAACWFGGRLKALRGLCGAAACGLRGRLRVAYRFKGQLLAALLVGVLVGAGAYFAGPWLAALASGAGGFAATLAVQAALLLRRMFTLPALREA
jgi:hypothetical protein